MNRLSAIKTAILLLVAIGIFTVVGQKTAYLNANPSAFHKLEKTLQSMDDGCQSKILDAIQHVKFRDPTLGEIQVTVNLQYERVPLPCKTQFVKTLRSTSNPIFVINQ